MKNQIFQTDACSRLNSYAFELQPIACPNSLDVVGHEVLYRGNRPVEWVNVDINLVEYFGKPRHFSFCYFINLSNAGLLSLPDDQLVLAAHSNSIFFELSEEFSNEAEQRSISQKVNTLSRLGVRFAIDDFGAGQDGLSRLIKLDHVTYIKVDGHFLQLAMQKELATSLLRSLVSEWRKANIAVIAESVENEAILSFCTDIGFKYVQGWHIDALVARLASQLPMALEA